MINREEKNVRRKLNSRSDVGKLISSLTACRKDNVFQLQEYSEFFRMKSQWRGVWDSSIKGAPDFYASRMQNALRRCIQINIIGRTASVCVNQTILFHDEKNNQTFFSLRFKVFVISNASRGFAKCSFSFWPLPDHFICPVLLLSVPHCGKRSASSRRSHTFLQRLARWPWLHPFSV